MEHCQATIDRNSSEPRLLFLMQFLRRDALWVQGLASLPNLYSYLLQSVKCSPQIQVYLFVSQFCKWPGISLIAFALLMYQKSLNCSQNNSAIFHDSIQIIYAHFTLEILNSTLWSADLEPHCDSDWMAEAGPSQGRKWQSGILG